VVSVGEQGDREQAKTRPPAAKVEARADVLRQVAGRLSSIEHEEWRGVEMADGRRTNGVAAAVSAPPAAPRPAAAPPAAQAGRPAPPSGQGGPRPAPKGPAPSKGARPAPPKAGRPAPPPDTRPAPPQAARPAPPKAARAGGGERVSLWHRILRALGLRQD
jgi:hypothetical protein